MVFLTTGAGWLTLMMRAERTRSGRDRNETLDSPWLLALNDPDILDDDVPPRLLAAE